MGQQCPKGILAGGPDLSEEGGAGSAQVVPLGVGVDRQRDCRIVAVPRCHDVHRQTAGQHQADANVEDP